MTQVKTKDNNSPPSISFSLKLKAKLGLYGPRPFYNKFFGLYWFLHSFKDGSAFQIIFKDRRNAANILASAIKDEVLLPSISLSDNNEVIVLGIPQGGVIIADVVATKLKAGFDIVISQRLLAPYSRRSCGAICAEDNSEYLDNEVIDLLRIKQDYIDKEKLAQREEIKRMSSSSSLYCIADNKHYDNIKDKTVILVDDGADRGSTLIVTARWIKKQQPKQLIIGVPVCSPDGEKALKQECDKLVAVTVPWTFGTINQFYRKFDKVTDQQVVDIIMCHKK